MTERNGSVMREILLDQYMTVETSHLRDREDADGTKGTGRYRKYFALCNVCAKNVVGSALQSEKCNVPRHDVAFQRSLCHFFRKCSCHDHLVFHFAERKLGRCGVAAVESHKCIFLCIVIFSFDIFFIKISRYGIVDIKQGNRILTDDRSDKFAERSVNIHFTGYRNSLRRQTAVHITWNKSELRLESRPAFSCDRNVFSVSSVCFHPVLQCQFILCKFLQDFRFFIAGAEFFFHLFHNSRDPLITCMLVICFK